MRTQISKLTKQLLPGVAVLGMAIAVSAFTSSKKMEELHIVNTPTELALISNYNSTNCRAGTETCAYKVLEPDALPGNQTEFTEAELADFLQAGWIEELPAKGVYQ